MKTNLKIYNEYMKDGFYTLAFHLACTMKRIDLREFARTKMINKWVK